MISTCRYTSSHMAKVHSLISESYMDDEQNQVQGYTYINDESNYVMAHLSLWSLLDIRNMLRCIQVSLPFANFIQYIIHF